jgi:hypothetical protein
LARNKKFEAIEGTCTMRTGAALMVAVSFHTLVRLYSV